MPDTHEERLLNHLLREIADADAALEGAGLESRVMARWEAQESPAAITSRPALRHARWVICGLAAAVLAAIVLTKPPRPVGHADGAGTTAAAVEPAWRLPAPRPVVRPAEPVAAGVESVDVPRTVVRRTPPRPQPVRTEDDTLSFVPLVPMSGQELSGSFQIVRVQMPRASLGALAAAAGHGARPFDELVEADVLLSEDGMARAIRVSTSGTVSPRRSR